MADYFAHVPVFAEDIFRRRFRMCKAMFLDISNDLNQEFEYFQRRSNHAGVPGFATIQKVTAAVRMLAYSGAADMFDEYVRMGESTMIECLNHFTRVAIEKYGDTYRRQPNDDDIARIASGTGPPVTYFVNGNEYNMGYYLADGIYPSWATLINGVPRPQSNKHKYFTQKQSEYRKDVECAFGQIQSMWGIMQGPARLWNPVDLNCIVECVVILNNMGIQYEANMEHISNEEYQSFSDEATISLPGT
ncbi:uncharacterized protein LOC112903610 [Panicum hallii]|uniref:uncharacterized protein LOC112903610 n=1 Tax=Panicum hallii TaxID=206008 RepID=UPI000DF4D852|nr:uncharacterized protein LOC112903610 [Panicum hallii]